MNGHLLYRTSSHVGIVVAAVSTSTVGMTVVSFSQVSQNNTNITGRARVVEMRRNGSSGQNTR